MGHFLLCFNAIMPMLLLMLFGLFLKRIRFIPDAGFAAMDRLCFKIFIPAVLFSNVYHADFSKDFQLKAVVFMELALIFVFILSFYLVPRALKCSNEISATLIHGLSHGNLAVLGLPLIQNLFGTEQMAFYSILVACTSPLINPLMVYEHLHFQGETLSPMKTIKNIMTSPFLIGTLLGLACNALRVVFPTFLETTLSNVCSIASPLCLIALGSSFKLTSNRTENRYAAGVALLKCVVIPAVVLLMAVLLGFRGIVLASLMVIFCCPSATATYSFCTGYCGKPSLAAQIVVISTLFSVFSMFGWLMLFLTLNLF